MPHMAHIGDKMTDPIKDEKPVADVQATPKEPSTQAQPTPEVDTGASSADVKQVPLPALQEERSKRQALEAEVANLRQQVSNTQMQHQQPQQQHPQVDPQKEIEELWDEDPKKAVRMEIMYAMDWRDRIDSGLEVQADTLSKKYPDFNNYRSVALGQVRNLPLNQRSGQGILEAAYFMVRGQNADTMIQQREAEWLEKYRRGEMSAQGLSTPPGSFSSPAVDRETSLTDEELRVASAMGLTAEGYASQRLNK